jgi:alkanesulfonate monooxygenase SsuD/methylene tetrahydromethanopterin reductase-like flavin-dependent oxidoreductase (luciferase family)
VRWASARTSSAWWPLASPTTNFYNEAYRRGGYADVAGEVQKLWVEGRREEAAKRVPDEMILQTSFLGTEAMVRERLRAYRDAGVTMLRLDPMGDSLADRLDTLGRALDLVRSECP